MVYNVADWFWNIDDIKMETCCVGRKALLLSVMKTRDTRLSRMPCRVIRFEKQRFLDEYALVKRNTFAMFTPAIHSTPAFLEVACPVVLVEKLQDCFSVWMWENGGF